MRPRHVFSRDLSPRTKPKKTLIRRRLSKTLMAPKVFAMTAEIWLAVHLPHCKCHSGKPGRLFRSRPFQCFLPSSFAALAVSGSSQMARPHFCKSGFWPLVDIALPDGLAAVPASCSWLAVIGRMVGGRDVAARDDGRCIVSCAM